MPVISRRDIALATRRAADQKYRKQLKAALQNPSLSAEQRQDLRERLQRIGKERVYDADSAPPPGAIELPHSAPISTSTPAPRYSPEELSGMKKADMIQLAKDHGVSSSGTKATIIERLASV